VNIDVMTFVDCARWIVPEPRRDCAAMVGANDA
jgi:hypothetical protein